MHPDRNAANTDVVEFARLGRKVSLHFRVDLRNRATFTKVMNTVMGGDHFDPVRVAETIGSLFDDAMRVEYGAESSTVLYIEVPRYPMQRLGDTGETTNERYSPEQRQDYARRVIEWAREMRADAITVQQHPATEHDVVGKPGDNPYRIRLWWD